MSDDTAPRKGVLGRWNRANQSPDAQKRLIADPERLWRLARDLAHALEEATAGHADAPVAEPPAP